MTDVAFYHLTRKALDKALPELLEKVVERGMRAVVLTGSDERRKTLNDLLWTWNREGFLPHGTAEDGCAERQPIWLTVAEENPNGASVLVLVDGMDADFKGGFARCLDLFDGRDEQAVAAARDRWRAAKASGHACTYWKQSEGGGWERGG